MRAGHPLSKGEVTPENYSSGRHVAISRAGSATARVDEALHALGLDRQIVTSVDAFSTALALARSTDLIASVPERHTEGLRYGLHGFRLPFPVPEITVSLIWHPRMDADQGHLWLRGCIREVCAKIAEPAQVRAVSS